MKNYILLGMLLGFNLTAFASGPDKSGGGSSEWSLISLFGASQSTDVGSGPIAEGGGSSESRRITGAAAAAAPNIVKMFDEDARRRIASDVDVREALMNQTTATMFDVSHNSLLCAITARTSSLRPHNNLELKFAYDHSGGVIRASFPETEFGEDVLNNLECKHFHGYIGKGRHITGILYSPKTIGPVAISRDRLKLLNVAHLFQLQGDSLEIPSIISGTAGEDKP